VTGAELTALLSPALERLAESRAELRELDAALGDGDLGITVAKGCEAVRAALDGLGDPSPAEVLRAGAKAFSTANPSTFAALAGGALLAAAKAIGDARDVGHDEAVTIVRAATESVMKRGKAELGDKTVLDALAPSADALERAGGERQEALEAMVAAARRGLEETAASESRRGRASWLQERSAGRPDPGATAYVRFLEALAAAGGRPG
jgi:dihydroxyacetone kinase